MAGNNEEMKIAIRAKIQAGESGSGNMTNVRAVMTEMADWIDESSGSGELDGYKIIAGVIRNTGTGWESISGHPMIGVDSINTNTQTIEIDHTSLGATGVVTFLAGTDDLWAGKYHVGFAGGNTISSIKIYENIVSQNLSLITHSGNGNFTASNGHSVTYDKTTTGNLTITLPPGSSAGNNMPDFYCLSDTEAEDTVWKNATRSLAGGVTTVRMYNMDGTRKNVANPEVDRFFFNQGSIGVQHVQVDPSTLVSSAGNIWFYALVKL